jgi:hypothetical protein
MTLTIQQKAVAYSIYKEHLVDNFKASELAEMLMARLPTQELDDELQNVVELCDIEEDGTY